MKPTAKSGCKCGACANHTHSHNHVHEHAHDHAHSHGHSHAHAHDSGGARFFVLMGTGAALYLLALFAPFWEPVRIALYVAAYLLIGGEVLLEAIKKLFRRQWVDESFLMAIATIGAFAIGEYAEAVAVMLFYQAGEYFQGRAVSKSRKSIEKLMDIRPDFARIEKDGVQTTVPPEQIEPGMQIIVLPGERIPLDGVIVRGSAALDLSSLTGESLPVNVGEGDTVLSGGINQTGMLTVRVTKPYTESTVSKILDLVENAEQNKAPAESFMTKFARVYTPLVVLAAVLLAAVPPLFFQADFSDWLYRALTFLVVSCPCALVISIPLSYFAGIGSCGRRGVLIKGGNYLETLCRPDTVVFDKTGTLTEGKFHVVKIAPAEGFDEASLLRLAAAAESRSNHPVAQSITAAYSGPADEILQYQEHTAMGVEAVTADGTVYAGSDKLMHKLGLSPAAPEEAGTVVHVALDGRYAGYLLIADRLKSGAKEAVSRLKALGVRQTVMLTGDRESAAAQIARTLSLDAYYSQLLPAQKVEHVEQLRKATPNRTTVFVGDGINDAPVLACADLGVAMGGLGSDAAIEAADVVLMNDSLDKLCDAVTVARKTRRVVIENIVFALTVKAVILILGAFGIAHMWAAVFADVGVALIAVLNSLRLLRA